MKGIVLVTSEGPRGPAYIRFSREPVASTEPTEAQDEVVVDYDASGGVVGVELDVGGDGLVESVFRRLGNRRRDRRGGFHGFDLLPVLGLLDLAELVVHLHAEVRGGATELVHKLADVAGELGQLLRTEEEQGDEEDDGAVLEAGHVLIAMIRQSAVGSA